MVSERVKVHVGLAAAIVVLIICFVLIIGGAMNMGNLRAALPGSVAPDFFLRDADNKPVELSDLRGNFIVVYFHGQGTGDSAACPTSGPAGSFNGPSVEQQSRAQASNSHVQNAGPKSPAVSDISQLSTVCRELHNPHVKFLDLESTAAEGSGAGGRPAGNLAGSSGVSATGDAVQTLIDPTGDVARKFRIAKGDANSTFLVIDPSGMISYRGSSLQRGALSAAGDWASPATQPSSGPQMAQTLFSSEALGLPSGSNHF